MAESRTTLEPPNGSDSTNRVDRLLPLLAGLAAVLPYSSLILSGPLVFFEIPYSDYGSYQLPIREFVRHEISQGRFPHWIPWIGCGIPLHATMQVGICYPLLTPLQLIFDANTSLKLALLIHIAVAYGGQYLLSRRLQLSPAAASLSAFVVAQSGYLTSHLAVGHVLLVFAYSLIPWLFLTFIEVCRRPGILPCCGLAVIVAMLLLVGHPQVPYYALLFGCVWSAVSLIAGEAAKQRIAVLTAISGGLLLGLALAAVQIIPTLTLLHNSAGNGSRGTFEHATMYDLDGVDLYRLVLPTLRGNPMVGVPEFPGLEFYQEKSCYLGLLTWCLMICGLLSGCHHRWPWAVATLALLALFISLGDSTPVFGWLFRTVPGIGVFRCPGRCLAVVSVCVALLAGRGFDSLTQSVLPLKRRTELLVILALLALSLYSAVLIDRAILSMDTTSWMEFAGRHLQGEFSVSAIALIASIAAVLMLPRLGNRQALLVTLLILSADLGYFNVRSISYQVDPDDRFRFPQEWDFTQDRLVEGRTSYHSTAVRYSRLVPVAVRSQARMLGSNEGGILPGSCEHVFLALDTNRDIVLPLAACGFEVSGPTWIEPSPVESLPRVWFCPDSLQPLLAKPIESVTGTDLQEFITASHATDVIVESDAPQRLVITVNTSTAGVLIVADTYYPEWVADVDGEEKVIQQVFGCFRGIAIEPGSHRITMSYAASSFRRGALVSGVGLLLLISLSSIGLWNHRMRNSALS